jgi:F0F1-type ATP synthase delta subunit
MYIKDYIEATHKVLKSGADTTHTLHALSKYLKKRGLENLYPAVLRGVAEKVRRNSNSTTPEVVLARESDFKMYKSEIEHALKETYGSSTHTTKIDENIIGGYIIESIKGRTDASYKNTLLNTYRRLTANN